MEHRENTRQIERTRLLDFARARFPSLSAEDLVQDASLEVYCRHPELAGEARFEALKAAVLTLAHSDKYTRQTDVRQPAEQVLEQPVPRPRVRPPRMPHTPKGLVDVRKPGSHVEPLSMGEGLPASPLQALMARRIYSEVIGPLLRGSPVSPDLMIALAESYDGFFGLAAEHIWVEVLVQEIAEAKKAKLAHRAADAAPAQPAVPTDSLSSIVLQATNSGLTKYRWLQKPKKIPVRPVLIHRNDNDGLVGLWGEIEPGKPQLLLFVTGTFGEWNPPEPYADELAWGNKVLLQTIQRLAQLDWGGLPEYVLDNQLITWLIDRMGFEGGGGRDHVAAATLMKWLISPVLLAEELEKYGRRIAERQYDDEANVTEKKFFSLAERVRACAELGRA